jgi:hypothetical protein
MKKGIIIGVIGFVVVGAAVVIIGLGSKTKPSSTQSVTTTKQSSQVVPVNSNPIQNAATAPGLAIIRPVVENNTDPATGQAVADRVQFAISNTSSQTINSFEVYYTVTDIKTHQSESYYQKLNGLSIPAGQSKEVFFDNGTGPGHYPENQYSLYRTSKNAVDVTIEVSAAGFQPAKITIQKGPGSGDRKD